jgi:tetratricopeptide (TPR) repeat protein
MKPLLKCLLAAAFCLHAASAWCSETTWQILDQAGWNELKADRFEAAERQFVLAVEEARRLGAGNYRVGISEIGRAWALVGQSQYEKALAAARTGGSLLKPMQISDLQKTMAGRSHHVLGRIHLAMGDLLHAETYLRDAIEIYQRLPQEGESLASALIDRARLARMECRILDGLKHLSEALQHTREPSLQAESLLGRADLLLLLGKTVEVQRLCDAGERMASTIRPLAGPTDGPSPGGVKQGAFTRGGATQPASRAEGHPLVHFAHLVRARLAFAQNDLTASRAWVLSVPRFHGDGSQGDRELERVILRGRLLAAAGDFSGAEAELNALVPMRLTRRQRAIAEVVRLELTGLKHFESGHYADAIATLQKAIAAGGNLCKGRDPVLSGPNLILARIYTLQATQNTGVATQCGRAESLLRDIQAVQPQGLNKEPLGPFTNLASHRQIAHALQLRGNDLLQRAKYEAASLLLEKAVSMFQQTLSETHPHYIAATHDLARAYWVTGSFAEAGTLLDKAHEWLDRRDGHGSAHPPALSAALTDDRLARTLCDGRADGHSLLAEHYTLAGWLAHAQCRYDSAELCFARAQQSWNSAPKTSTSWPGRAEALLGSALVHVAREGSDSRALPPLREAIVMAFYERMKLDDDQRFRRLYGQLAFEFWRHARIQQRHEHVQEALWLYLWSKRMYGRAGHPEYALRVQREIDQLQTRKGGPLMR